MSSADEELLEKWLDMKGKEELRQDHNIRFNASESLSLAKDGKEERKDETHSQWAVNGNSRFCPVGDTVQKLKAGVYAPFAVPGMYGLEELSITSDGIYSLPDMATEIVLKEVQQFWNSEDKYRKHNLLFKRGILCWGPPGSGKTITVKLLMQELVKRDGIVIIINSISIAIEVLKALRRIEPKRHLIMVFEDIDEIIYANGEAIVLSLLDGEHNLDRILALATTNFPEKLGARILNRPSRFDRRVYIGMPEAPAREVYLIKATQDGLDKKQLVKWVKDTSGMSIAHLRELVAAVYCLEQPYGEVIERLRHMSVQPKGESGFTDKLAGFSVPSAKTPFFSASGSGG